MEGKEAKNICDSCVHNHLCNLVDCYNHSEFVPMNYYELSEAKTANSIEDKPLEQCKSYPTKQ